jgi:hypothetical protein
MRRSPYKHCSYWRGCCGCVAHGAPHTPFLCGDSTQPAMPGYASCRPHPRCRLRYKRLACLGYAPCCVQCKRLTASIVYNPKAVSIMCNLMTHPNNAVATWAQACLDIAIVRVHGVCARAWLQPAGVCVRVCSCVCGCCCIVVGCRQHAPTAHSSTTRDPALDPNRGHASAREGVWVCVARVPFLTRSSFSANPQALREAAPLVSRVPLPTHSRGTVRSSLHSFVTETHVCF